MRKQYLGTRYAHCEWDVFASKPFYQYLRARKYISVYQSIYIYAIQLLNCLILVNMCGGIRIVNPEWKQLYQLEYSAPIKFIGPLILQSPLISKVT